MRYALLLLLVLCLSACAGGLGARNKAGEEMDLFQVRHAAEVSYAAKDYAESEKHYALLTQKMPVEAENWFRLGNIYARTNRPDTAIAAYKEALVRAPDYSKAWFNMAILQLNTAASSLIELQKSAPPEDPIVERSRDILKGLQGLIKGGATKDAAEADAPTD
jgi:cytochrome c-type biogenesis protein CcmH/NrfG